jgi:hypothetical protein
LAHSRIYSTTFPAASSFFGAFLKGLDHFSASFPLIWSLPAFIQPHFLPLPSFLVLSLKPTLAHQHTKHKESQPQKG